MVFLGLAACAAAGGDGAGGSGGDATDDTTTGTGATTVASASTSATTTSGVSACISSTPCASDLQCTAMPGFACNGELPTPMCQRLSCGDEIPCDGRDEFCAPDRMCRIVDHAAGLVCLPETLGAQDCLTSCQTAPVESLSGCFEDPHLRCPALCGRPLCTAEGGLKHVENIYRCDFNGAFAAVDFGVRCVDGSWPTYTVSD